MDFTATDIVSFLISFEILLFAFYLLTLRVEEKRKNYFIVLFLLLLGIDINSNYLNLFYENYPQFAYILDIVSYLMLPSLYLYIRSAAFKDFSFKKVDLLHLIPSLVVGFFLLLEYHLQPLERKLFILETGGELNRIFLPIAYSFFIAQIIIYSFLSYSVVNRYAQIVNENYSNAKKNNFRWLRQLILAFYFILAVAMLKNLAKYFMSESLFKTILSILRICDLVFISWIILKALKRPHLFTGVDSQIKVMKELIREQSIPLKAEKIELPIQEEELHKKLLSYMMNFAAASFVSYPTFPMTFNSD